MLCAYVGVPVVPVVMIEAVVWQLPDMSDVVMKTVMTNLTNERALSRCKSKEPAGHQSERDIRSASAAGPESQRERGS